MTTKLLCRFRGAACRPATGGWALAAAAAAMSGCAGRQPIEAWQQRVTAYISEEGNGDPNVLRDLTIVRARDSIRPERVMIGEFGVAGRTKDGVTPTYDVQGVLIGHTQVAGRNWFVFLVGVLRQRTSGGPIVEDVRLSAMTADRRDLHWLVTEPDAIVTRRYVSPDGTDPTAPNTVDPAFRVFPKSADSYRMVVDGDFLHVYEDRSGAHWGLRLPPAMGRP